MFLISLEWEELFPSAYARTLPYILSDHILILLDTRKLVMWPTIFRFGNMWFSHANFDSQVSQFWSPFNVTNRDPVVVWF